MSEFSPMVSPDGETVRTPTSAAEAVRLKYEGWTTQSKPTTSSAKSTSSNGGKSKRK